VFQHLRPQIALAAVGLLLIAALLYGVSRQAFERRPARGGQLVEALVGRPATLNPLFATGDSEIDLVRLLFSGLTRPDAQGRLGPDLATNWSISSDGLQYTFTLRPDAVWHDGVPVTAEDVRFTAALAADPNLQQKTSLAAPWEHVAVEVVDPHTVRFVLDEPYAPFLQATSLGLLPAHLLASVRPAELVTHRFSTLEPIGTGPYRLIMPGGITGDTIRLERFDEHWNATDRQPYLDEILFRIYPTQAAALEALAQRAVQALGDAPPDTFDILGEDARFYSAGGAGYTLIYLNPASAMFGDDAVRRALSLSLDRTGIVNDPALLNGQGIPAASPIAPGSWAHDPNSRAVPYRPEDAARILDDAGWIDSDSDGVRDRDGRNLTFSLETANDPLLVAIAERIAADWADIGVAATRRVLDQQSTVRNLSNRAFDAMLFGWERHDYDPDPYPLWHSSQATDGQNYADWRSPEADSALVRARGARPDDYELRASLYLQFEQRFAEEEPALMIYHPVYTYAVVDPNLGGIQLPQLIAEPADRFQTLPDWYVRTERVFRSTEGRRRPTATP